MKKLKLYKENKIRFVIPLIILISSFFLSCAPNHCEDVPDTSNISLDIHVERLDKKLSKISSIQELKSLIASNPELKDVFSAGQFPSDSIFYQEFYKILSDDHVDTVFQDVENAFGDLSGLEAELEDAFKNLKFYYPNFSIPTIKTVASGFFSPDFYFTDSVIYIALDYFTGTKGHYPPPNEPEYIAKRYRKEYIVPIALRVLSTSLNATDVSDKTMLAEMIYWGKSYYFLNKILPCTPDSLLIGYTEKQLNASVANQERIWSHFVERQLLYETSHFIKTKYIGDRPYTAEISSKAPGRIGQWLGWKIVNKYMEEKGDELNLQGLMAIKSASKIFNESKFKPKDGEDL